MKSCLVGKFAGINEEIRVTSDKGNIRTNAVIEGILAGEKAGK